MANNDISSNVLAGSDNTPQDGPPVLHENSFTKGVDRLVQRIGDGFSWLWLVLLAVIIANVVLRYVFSQGMIELEELQWYLYAAAWLVGLSYTFVTDGHVRVDVVSERLPRRVQLWLEVCGLIALFMPFVLFVIYYSLPFVSLCWTTGETSSSGNGLPARWLIKGCLTFSFGLLFLVGLSRLVKVVNTLRYAVPTHDRGVAS